MLGPDGQLCVDFGVNPEEDGIYGGEGLQCGRMPCPPLDVDAKYFYLSMLLIEGLISFFLKKLYFIVCFYLEECLRLLLRPIMFYVWAVFFSDWFK